MTPEASNGNAASARLAVDAEGAKPADVVVRVVDRARDQRNFECTVSSPLLEELRDPQPEPWVLGEAAGELVRQYMERFAAPDNDNASRLLALKGAGVQLWKKAAPENFKAALAKLREAGHEIATIQVISQEPHIPWELMIADDDPRPIGVRYAISRWFIGTSPLRSAGTPAADARVAAPRNDPPPGRLKLAKAEAELVCNALAGKELEATSAAALAGQLQAWTGTILHFVSHGISGPPQALLLDGKARLSSVEVAGMVELVEAWRESAPVVFLNACKAGQPAPSLDGAGGLVLSWVEVGAGAVIAPLWSVRDAVAHKVAEEFYAQIKSAPTTRYAEIVRDIRARAWSTEEDSYAAYSYFGSPWAAAA